MKNPQTRTSSTRRRPFIKVCGQLYTGTVDCAAAYGASYVGFNFCAGSPRYVTPAHAAGMPSVHMKRVGVFDASAPQEICRIMQEAGLHLAQLEGNQTTEDALQIGPQRVIRSLRISPDATPEELQSELERWTPYCRTFLVECSNASLLAAVEFPHPWILSGRMNADALQEMLRTCLPDGVDIESCVGCAETMAAMRAVT